MFESPCVQLYLSPREYQQLEKAILKNGGKQKGGGLAGKEAAIMRIVRQTNQGNDGHPKESKLARGKSTSLKRSHE
jgi:hypothetical protein